MSLAVKSARMGVQTGMPMGDPGLFGFLGKVVKKVGGAVLGGAAGLLGGGPIGAVSGALGSIAGGGGSAGSAMIRTGGVGGSILRGGTAGIAAGAITRALGPGQGGGRFNLPGGIQVSPGDFFPGGAPFISPGAGAAGACPRGHRPNKTAYFLKSGQFVPVGSRCVKIRRRNPLNPRALSRSLSRVESFQKKVKRSNKVMRKACR